MMSLPMAEQIIPMLDQAQMWPNVNIDDFGGETEKNCQQFILVSV